jgi:GNAT superfamily N-acetyltransferase
MRDLVIRPITAMDKAFFADALELLNRTQGRDLFGPGYMDKRTTSPSTYVVGAFLNDILVGLGVAELIDNLDYYRPFQPSICEDLRGKKVGSLATLCVTETLQGKGIGQKITQRRLEWLQGKNCDIILGVSWVSGLSHTSNRVFDKLGFTAVNKVDQFYRQSSLEHPFICPQCGVPPCKCAAILYMSVTHLNEVSHATHT